MSSEEPTPKSSLLPNLLLMLGAFLVAFLLAEIAVRMIGEVRDDGQFYFNDIPVRPNHLTIEHTAAILDEYAAKPNSYKIYDPLLGWTLRPDTIDTTGLYYANSAGIRSDREYALEPDPDVLRIAIFGDSFTHSSNVSYEESWGYQLELLLNESGIEAEVLNFGVGGYGMDQAYLRWQLQGKDYQPDLVIFGLRAENAYRNMNVVRSIYQPQTGMPFSKPRYALNSDGTLELVNSPTVPPEEMIELLENFDRSPLREYETFYNETYVDHWWLQSRLIALMVSLNDDAIRAETKRNVFYQIDGEAAQLTLAILSALGAEVEATGAEFMVIYLPTRSDMKAVENGDISSSVDMLAAVEANHLTIRPDADFGTTDLDDYFEVVHYSEQGNGIIAQNIFDAIRLTISP